MTEPARNTNTGTANFKLDTDNYLGFEYENYIHDLESMALTKPSEYYAMRSKLLKALKGGIVKDTFNAYYTLLTEGSVAGGFDMFNDYKMCPNYPKQEASAFAIQAAKTVNQILDKAMEEIMPASHLNISKIRMVKLAEGQNMK